MNRNFHRVIFNAARGLRMVVQETARSAGKATSGATGAVISVAATFAALTSAPLHAQIVADPNAPGRQRPTILAAPNGVPLVNVRAPSAAGVSRNTYSQFDVNGNGVILNNSRTDVRTQLGGFVQGNPWLSGGSARIVVNQVNSSDPSYLRGYVEVAGPRTEVIIANPSGISVDGGGFINAYRATLTTGTPQYGAAGSLDSYVVRGGTVGITGAGLDASGTDSLSLLSRAFALSGALHATDLKVVAGANQISSDLSGITPIAGSGTGTAPAYAIDVAQLGGMYANHIALVVNEQGVGARNAGTIQTSTGTYALAGAGKLTLSVDGILENSGLVQTASDAVLRSASLANSGTVQSAATLQIKTRGDLANHIAVAGGTLEGQRLELGSATGDIDNRSGTLRQTGRATLEATAPKLSNTQAGFIGSEPVAASSGGSGQGAATSVGSTTGGGTATTSTGTSSMPSGSLAITGTTTPAATVSPGSLDAAGSLLNDGGRIYAGGIALNTSNLNNAGGTLNIANLNVGGPSFSNAGGKLSVTNAFTADVGTLDNAGGTLNAGRIVITTTGDLNNQGGTLASDGKAELTVGGTLDNGLGTVQSGTDVSVRAGSLANTGATASIRAENDSTVTVRNAFSNEGRITAGRHVAVTARTLDSTSGSVIGAGIKPDGTVGAAGDLGVTTTGALKAAGSVLAGGNVTLQGASVDLSGSTVNAANVALTATAGDATTRHATVTTPGSLSVKADAFSGQSLVNEAGMLSAGEMTVAVGGTLDNAAGTVSSSGGLTVRAGSFDQDRGSTTARQVTIDAESLSNVGGTITQTGTEATHITVTGTLNNASGHIASDGKDFALSAATLVNASGTVQHAGAGTLDIGVARTLSGAKGRIASNGILNAHGGDFDLDGGTTSAEQITMNIASLSNAAGSIVQDGTGTTHIATVGNLVNDHGTVISNATDVELAAGGTLSNAGGHLRHAGTGNLNLAAKSYEATGGELVTNGALVAKVTGAFDQDGGSTGAQRITIDTGSLSNVAGAITQSGTGATHIAVTGRLTNDGGTIVSNGAAIGLKAGTLSNAGGHLRHTGSGTLNIDVGTLVGINGEITTNEALVANVAGAFDHDGGSMSARRITLHAGSLSNRGGEIVQTGSAATALTIVGALDNSTGGTIASNGDLTVSSASLSNHGGSLRATATASLDLATTGSLDNGNAGVIGAGGNAVLHAGSLVNDIGSVTAVGDLAATVSGAASNVGGTLAANGKTTLAAASLDNTRGSVAAVRGDLAITTTGTTNNTSGKLQAAGNTSLANAGLVNAQGKATGNTLSVNTNGKALDNSLGTLGAATTVELQSGALDNDRGLIQSGGAMTIDTHAHALKNTNAAGHSSTQGGIDSGSTLILNAGAVDNTAGFIGASKTLKATTGDFTNASGGEVHGQAEVVIKTSGATYDNRGGQTLALGDLTIDAGNGIVRNSGALIRSVARTSVSADTVTNTATNGVNQGIEGRNVAIAAQHLDNDAGKVLADMDATVTGAGTVSNVNGLVSAGGMLAILDANRADAAAKRLSVVNTGGTLTAGKSLQLDAATFSADGRLVAQEDISVALTQNLVNNATVSANHNLTYTTTGNLKNSGKLVAGNVLTVAGNDVENTASGEMVGDTTIVKASGTLTNRGLIDGRDTQVDAATLGNIGTGRIYGDHLSIAAGTLDNLAETVHGDTKAGTISARNRLDIGARTLRNGDGALVFSGEDLFIGAALDASRQATGAATLLENRAATIEALNNVDIRSTTLDNLNGGVTWYMEPKTEQVLEFTPSNSTLRFKASEVFVARGTRTGWTATHGVAPDTTNDAAGTRLLIPSPSYPISKFAAYYAQSPALSKDSSYQMPTGIADEMATVAVPGAWYAPSDPIWAAFGVTAPARKLPSDNPIYLDPDIAVGQTGTPSGRAFAHPVTQAEYDEAHAYFAAHEALDKATQTFINVIYAGTDPSKPDAIAANAGTPNGMYADYTVWNYTATTQTPVLDTSRPGQIVSGGDMTLAVGSGTNEMSQILAGRKLTVTGGTIANKAQEVQATTTTSDSTAVYTYEKSTRHYRPTAFDITIPPTTVTLAAARQEGNQSAVAGKKADASTFTAQDADTFATGAIGSGNRVHPIVEVPSVVGGAPGVTGTTATTVQATPADAAPARGDSSGAPAATGTGGKTSAGAGQNLVVRTTVPNADMPRASVFRTTPGAASHYLVETDPAFASYRDWLSSDYLLDALRYDPDTVAKRLGDGFYEQRLVREQVAQLTGYRYLEGLYNDQDQYAALMDAGVTFAKAFQLTPGIALSAAQMAQLTSDIVWLVEQTVTLADGSTQKVLVPQVYVRVRPGDIDGSGALLSADSLHITTDPGAGDVVSNGTLAGRTMVAITADNVKNLGGRISSSAGSVDVKARNDLDTLGGTIDAMNSVRLRAEHDLTIESTTQTAVGARSSATAIDRVAGVYVTNPGGTLVASAGHDVNLVGAILSSQGSASVKAGNDINLGTVKTASSQDATWNAKNYSRRSESAEVGTTIVANGMTTLNAGNDIQLRQATIDAGAGLLSIHADRNISISAGQSTQSAEEARSTKKSGLLTGKTTTTQNTSDETLSHGTRLSGGLVSITANGDITGEGVKISGTDGVLVHAGNKLSITEARDSRSESNSQTVKKSGFAGSIGGIPVPIGAGSRNDTSTSSNTAVASSITSANGGVRLQGDGAAILRGVQVNAAEDVTIRGGTVSITGATNYASSTSEQYTRGTKIGASLVHDLGKGIDAKNTDKGEQQASTLARTTLSGANVTVTSTGTDGKGGLLTMTGTTVNTPGTLTLNADKLILDTQTTQTDVSNTSQGGDVAWIKNKGEGSSDQATNYNQFNVGTLATPVNSVQIGLGAKDSVSALAQQPGMAWVNQIANDPKLAGKVDWTKIEEAHSQWDYKQQGLTPAAAERSSRRVRARRSPAWSVVRSRRASLPSPGKQLWPSSTGTCDTAEETLSHGTSLSGDMVSVTANGDITGERVKIRVDKGALVHAGGVLDLHEARDVRSASSSVRGRAARREGRRGQGHRGQRRSLVQHRYRRLSRFERPTPTAQRGHRRDAYPRTRSRHRCDAMSPRVRCELAPGFATSNRFDQMRKTLNRSNCCENRVIPISS